MQNIEIQYYMENTGNLKENVKNANPELPQIFNKKELFFYLYPQASVYDSRTLRGKFFSDDLLNKLKLTPEEYNQIRVFTFQQTCIIKSHIAAWSNKQFIS